jgi:hypothetical protein
LERNPRVTFDDIAELTDAKTVLKEAVLLPLLMPSFFQVRHSAREVSSGDSETLEGRSDVRPSWHRQDDAGPRVGECKQAEELV